MSTLIGHPALIPQPLAQLVHDFVARSYHERLKRAGADDCELCGARPHPDATIEDQCEKCGFVEARAAELRATGVLVPYAVPGAEDEELPI